MKRSLLTFSALAFIFLSVFSQINAEIIDVPEDFNTIQGAIDDQATQDGDTILVAANTYQENINFNGKNIVLIGNPDDPGQVVIDGNQDGSVVVFSNSETEDAVLCGLTLQNGRNMNNGGGVWINNSNPTFENLIIKECQGGFGGGISMHGCTSAFRNVVISENHATSNGAGMDIAISSTPVLMNVTLTGNTSDNQGGAIWVYQNSHPTLINCILWNDTPQEVAFPNDRDQEITISYSDLQGGEDAILTQGRGEVHWGAGNLDADPLFIDPDNGDYHLTEDSPCIDAGDPNSDLDPDGTQADMGAFYFNQIQREITLTIINGWNLFSIPLIPDNPLRDHVFQNLRNEVWDLFGFDPRMSYYRPNELECGKGYWLTINRRRDIDIPVHGLANTDPVSLYLFLGWNCIGNPFLVEIPFEEVTIAFENEVYTYEEAIDDRLISPILYYFGGVDTGYLIDDEFTPLRGYMVQAFEDSLLLTFSPDDPLPSPDFYEPERDEPNWGTFEDWRFTICAFTAGGADLITTLGANENASYGFNPRFDYPEPPNGPNGQPAIRAFFRHNDWFPRIGNAFNHDIRAQMVDETYIWTMRVETNSRANVTLLWPEILQTTPPGYEYEIIDTETDSVLNPKAQPSYSFECNFNRNIDIRVHSSLSAKSNRESILDEFVITSIYPNPFNNSTKIEYNLPEAADIKLYVLDVSGRTVSKLVESRRLRGSYTAIWDASDTAPGLYFTVLEAASRKAVQKTILIK